MRYVLLALSFLLLGCEVHSNVKPKTPIIALYMHEVGNYSVAVQEGEHIRMIEFRRQMITIPTKIIADVPNNDSMWFECFGTYHEMKSWSEDARCEIHIRNIDDINTAGWDHGKFGKGNTIRIQ